MALRFVGKTQYVCTAYESGAVCLWDCRATAHPLVSGPLPLHSETSKLIYVYIAVRVFSLEKHNMCVRLMAPLYIHILRLVRHISVVVNVRGFY